MNNNKRMNRKREKKVLVVLCGLIGILTFVGCTTQPKESGRRTFPTVTVPTVYAETQARAEYLVMRYWDRFDFNDTVWVGSSELTTEQALVEYLSILPYASYDVICKGINQLLDRADQNQAMYAFFYSKMEFYFSSPNSAFRNEEFYIPVLEHMVKSSSLDQPRKVRPNAILPVLQKNRPGTQAAEIHYTMASGVKNTLSNVKSDYILVLFYDFDCEDCNVLKGMMEESTIINEMQAQKKLAILAIYPGANMEGWRRSLVHVPASWINGYDHDEEIGREGTYEIRSIPTLYLLDRNYMVIMKEPPFNYVEYYLDSILNPPDGV